MARVLLIDDDRSKLDFMQQLLGIERHELAWAADGEQGQGLALMRQLHPQLIICDIVMPHLGGFAVLDTVRADQQLADVPVLLFSAAMSEEVRAIGLQRGASEVLAKPFEMEELRGAVRRCLGQEP